MTKSSNGSSGFTVIVGGSSGAGGVTGPNVTAELGAGVEASVGAEVAGVGTSAAAFSGDCPSGCSFPVSGPVEPAGSDEPVPPGALVPVAPAGATAGVCVNGRVVALPVDPVAPVDPELTAPVAPPDPLGLKEGPVAPVEPLRP